MGLGPFIVIMKELKAYVFNAKEKKEISYGYWRILSSNLLGRLQQSSLELVKLIF
jgi:hypothetical protein